MWHRKSYVFTAALVLLSSVWVYAGDENEKEHHGQAYVFFAPGGMFQSGGHIGTAHVGGGGEVLLYKGLGAGAEVGYVTPWKEMSGGIGILSVDGSYHFRRNRKLSPFITAGYSLGFREGHGNLVNFGGGVHWWFKEQMGLRLEFRDHIYPNGNYPAQHYAGGRIGLSFR